MIPPIRIQVNGNRCSCCTDENDAQELKVVYRGDKGVFVAVPKEKELDAATVAATRAALNKMIMDIYSIHLADLSVDLAPNGAISVRQIRRIENMAAQKFKKTESDSSL